MFAHELMRHPSNIPTEIKLKSVAEGEQELDERPSSDRRARARLRHRHDRLRRRALLLRRRGHLCQLLDSHEVRHRDHWHGFGEYKLVFLADSGMCNVVIRVEFILKMISGLSIACGYIRVDVAFTVGSPMRRLGNWARMLGRLSESTSQWSR